MNYPKKIEECSIPYIYFFVRMQQKCLQGQGQAPNPLLHLSSSSRYSTFVFHPSILSQIVNYSNYVLDLIDIIIHSIV